MRSAGGAEASCMRRPRRLPCRRAGGRRIWVRRSSCSGSARREEATDWPLGLAQMPEWATGGRRRAGRSVAFVLAYQGHGRLAKQQAGNSDRCRSRHRACGCPVAGAAGRQGADGRQRLRGRRLGRRSGRHRTGRRHACPAPRRWSSISRRPAAARASWRPRRRRWAASTWWCMRPASSRRARALHSRQAFEHVAAGRSVCGDGTFRCGRCR